MAGKFQTLQRLSSHLPVPTLTALSGTDFEQLWSNYHEMASGAERILASIALTSAAFLDEHLDELAAVLHPVWRSTANAFLDDLLRSAGLGFDTPMAVRSSGAAEDSDELSYAGLFQSCLNVRGPDELRAAIVQVWSSNYGRAVVLERLRNDDLRTTGTMTVIVQRMVHATWAGVAFSHDPVSGEEVCVVEAVAGVGEALVSGEVRGVHARFPGQAEDPQPAPADPELAPILRRVRGLVAEVQRLSGGEPVDIEWAADADGLWLLQMRPITTIGRSSDDLAPSLRFVGLYEASDADIEPFRPLPDFAQYFRGKRKPLMDFSLRMGVQPAAALLVRANRQAFEDAALTEAFLAQFGQPEVVVDLSAQVRQQVLDRQELVPRLRELLGTGASTFAVREYVRGEGGFITQALPGAAARVLCEWSPDGLLALNRGTASTASFVVSAGGEAAPAGAGAPGAPFDAAQWRLMHRATIEAQQVFGQVQLEWAYDRGRVYLVDYSRLELTMDAVATGPSRVVSVGYASGVPLVVQANRSIEQLSIAASVSLTHIPGPHEVGEVIGELYERMRQLDGQVIIVSPRPYAALASLIPYAAGFVFEQASTLCHLAILLRERGVPALESPALYQHALQANNVPLTLDSSIPQLQEL